MRERSMKKCIIDADHSVAAFAIRHLSIAYVRGMFTRLSGNVYYDAEDVSRSAVEAVIDVTSLSTGVRKRDMHVLSEEMLDAGKFPTITFKSTAIAPTARGQAAVHGDLTIHGVTRPVMLDVRYFGPVRSPFGGEVTIGFSASAKVDREDFGVLWGSDPLDEGGFVASREVEITIDIEADIESS
jgi:polyisoprenoid-binding protein YceI